MAIKNYEHCCSTVEGLATLGKIEGVVPLVHGPQPCVYQNQVASLYCRPAQLVTAGTLVSKSEVIFGGENALKQQIRNVYDRYKPKLVVVMSTCVSQLTAEDIQGVAYDLEDEIPGLAVTVVQTGFNYHRSMPLGSDAAWVAVVRSFAPKKKRRGSVGIIGRAGQDAGNLAGVEVPLRAAGLEIYPFPTGHIDDMAEIVKAETLFPIHITSHLTCKEMKTRFQQEYEFVEIPAGIQGTSGFLRAVADRRRCQKLHDVVDKEEKRLLPKLDAIKSQFAKNPQRILLVTGPGNEVSIGKILAEFGAEVFVVPSMHNAFYQAEKRTLQERHGVTFIEKDFDTLDDLVDEVHPTAVVCEFQGQVETLSRMMPTLINQLYLGEYGYDYAIDLGTRFFEILHGQVYDHWKGLAERYGVSC